MVIDLTGAEDADIGSGNLEHRIGEEDSLEVEVMGDIEYTGSYIDLT